jgi:hypothetical protein
MKYKSNFDYCAYGIEIDGFVIQKVFYTDEFSLLSVINNAEFNFPIKYCPICGQNLFLTDCDREDDEEEQ